MKKMYLLIFIILFGTVRNVNASGNSPGALGPVITDHHATQVITTFPWTEGFENAGAIPQEWSQSYVIGTTNWDFRSGSSGSVTTPHTGSYNAVFKTTTRDNTTRLVTPELDLSAVYHPELTFWHSQEYWGSDLDILHVYYKLADETDWILLESFTDEVPVWTKQTISLASIPTTSYVQIAFEAVSDYGYGVLLDDIMIAEGPNCIAVDNLSVLNITSNSADIQWNSYGSETEWLISYKAQNETWSPEESVYNPEYLFPVNSLNPATTYSVRVRAYCGNGDSSDYRTISFLTECDINLPLFENFDSAPTGTSSNPNAPLCWSYVRHYSSSSAYVSTTSPYSSPNCYYLSNSSASSSQKTALISPVLPDEVSNLRVRFMAKGGSGYVLHVGYLTDPEDISTFVLQQSVSLTSAWAPYIVTFDDVSVSASVVCFMHGQASTYQSIYLDNMIIEEVPQCADMDVTTIKAGETTTTSAEIYWQEIDEAIGYEIRYRKIGTTSWTEEPAGMMPHMISGLQASTEYEVSVRSICNEGLGAWTESSLFWTAFSVPFSQYFDGDVVAPAWYSYKNANSPGTLNSSTTTGNFVSAPRGVNLSNGASSASDRLFFISPIIDPSVSLNTVQVRFKAKGSVRDLTLSVGMMNLDSLNSFTLVESVPLTREWQTYTVTFENYNGNDYRIAFGHNGNTPSTSIYLDNMDISFIEQCPEVTNIYPSNVRSDGFTLDWRDVGVSSYTIEYWENGSGNVQIANASLNSYDFTGLSSLTDYQIRISADCTPQVWSDTFHVRTTQVPVSIPFAEDFETDPEWVFVNGSQTNKWVINRDSVANLGTGGVQCLYISRDSVTYNYNVSGLSRSYALKAIDFDEAGDYLVKYQWKNRGESAYYDYLQVWLVPGDETFTAGQAPTTAGWINLYGSANLWNQTSWQEKEILVMIENPGVYNLVFYWYNDASAGTNPPAAVDNIEITKLDCSRITEFAIENIRPNEIDITFQAPSNTDRLRLIYKTASSTVWTDSLEIPIQDPSTETSFTLNGLTTATSYTMMVKTVCQEGGVSHPSATLSFTTACDAFPLPWEEDFDAVSTFPPNICWDRKSMLFDPSETMYTADMTSNTSWIRESTLGNYASRLYITSTTTKSWLISPEFDMNDGQDYYLQFDIKLSSNSSGGAPSYEPDDKFIVLVSTDGGVSWNPSHAVVWSSESSADYSFTDLGPVYTSYVIPLTGMTGNVKIAFYGESTVNGVSNYLYLDNILVSNCPRPVNITVHDITANEAVASWSSPSDIVNQYELVIGPAGFDPDMADPSGIISLFDTAYLFTGLNPVTQYDVYVRSVCSGSQQGVWTKKVNFITTQIPAELPFVCGFEDEEENSNWSFVNSTVNYWRIGNEVSHTGDSSLYITNGTSYAYNHGLCVTWAYRDVIFDESDEFVLSFDWKAWGESSHDYFRVYIGDPSEAPTANSSGTITVPAGAVLIPRLNAAYTHFNLDSVWSNHTYFLDTSYSSKLKRIYFVWRNDGSGGSNPPAAIDNITIIGSDCPRPVALYTDAVTSVSAEVHWSDISGSSPYWEVVHGPAGFDPEGISPYVSVYDTVYAMTNLTEDTEYDFYVRTVCGGGSVSFWEKISFRTPCEAISQFPFLETFESTSATLPCWRVIDNNGDGDAWAIYTGYAHTGTSSAGIYTDYNAGNNDDYLISPPLNLGGNEFLKFYVRARSTGEPNDYEVLLSTTGTKPSDFNVVLYSDTVSTTSYEEVEILLNNYSGTVYIAFHIPQGGLDGYYLYIDDVSVESIPSCLAPQQVTVSNITTNSATFQWNEMGQATLWEIEYGTLPGYTAGNGTRVVVTSNPYTESSLTGATHYGMHVRAICGPGDTSEWNRDMVRFGTECAGALSLPYSQNFDSYTGTAFDVQGEIPLCWYTSTNNTQYPAPHVIVSGGSYAYVSSQPNAFVMTCGTTGSGADTYAVLPEFDSPFEYLKLYFNYRMESVTHGVLHVGYIEGDQSDLSSFQSLKTITSTTTMTRDSVIMSDYTIPATAKYIAFYWNNSTGSYYSVGIDDILVDSSSVTPIIDECDAPAVLQIPSSSITSSSASVSWTPGGNETLWQVELKKNADANYTILGTSSSTSYSLTGLDPLTLYDVRVKSLCGQDVESGYTYANFTTLQAGTAYYTITATSHGNGSINPSGEIRVPEGGNQSFTVTAENGSSVEGIWVDGEMVNDRNGYTFTNVLSDHTIEVRFTVGLEDYLLEKGVSLYPNPVTSVLTVCLTRSFTQVEIIDLLGKVIYAAPVSESDFQLNVSNYRAGVYFLRLKGDEGTVTKKFIKE